MWGWETSGKIFQDFKKKSEPEIAKFQRKTVCDEIRVNR